MHKLYEFACAELEELEKKAGEKGLSAAELEYANKLTEMKKNILKIEMLEDEGYSAEYRDDMMSYAKGGNRGMNRGGNYNRGGSYSRGRGRNTRRDSTGRYSREGGYSRAVDDIVEQLEDMMEEAPDERTRMEIKKLIDKMGD